ncbi:MAG: DAK2 domain-containing protein [Clostridia bacterium]|nr:DAK2 domain-containing protein [Clostridia bacterium]
MDDIMNDVNCFDVKILGGELFGAMVMAGAANLRANAEEVNELNVFPVPDGDTGDNMSMTAEGGSSALRKIDTASESLGEVAGTVSRGMLLGARGNSGVILSQMFAGMARAFEKKDKADIHDLCSALALGVKQAYAAVMKPTEGTILTVVREGVQNTVTVVENDWSVGRLFEHLLGEMKISLEHTPEILPVLKEAGVVDSGGAGVVYIFEGFLKALKGEKIEAAAPMRAVGSDIDLSAFGPDSVMTYGYCTELLLQLQNSKVDPDEFDPAVITEYLETLGDSIVSFKTGSIVKIHVHTLTPEKVLEFCRRFGEFLTLKIENMSVQHSESLTEKKEEKKEVPASKKPRTKFGYVAVASGGGIERLFLDLGANYVVDGGQTKNPSTSDFLEAFEETNADHIFVLPNNGNIILAATQASEIYKDSVIHVIPSKDIGMGYVAMSTLDMSSEDPDEIESQLISAMENVSTGSVSPAVRDAELNGVKIKNGDFIGFVGKQMLVSKAKMVDTACGLLDNMIDEDKFMLTVFCGRDAKKEDCAALESYVAEAFPDVEVYFADGGQDVYPFIFVVEG